MLTWALVGETFLGSSPYQSGSVGGQRWNFVAVEPSEPHEIEIKYLGQGGPVPGLDWKSVEHWHADGNILLDATPEGTLRVADVLSASSAPDVLTASNGFYGLDGTNTLFVFAGGSAQVVIPRSPKDWIVMAAETWYDDRERLRISGYVSSVTYEYNWNLRKYIYRTVKTTWFGYNPLSWGKYSSEFAECLPQWEINRKSSTDAAVATINRSYTATNRPRQIPTPEQVKSLVIHDLGEVIASSLIAQYDKLEQLHATAFDSVMKFDGNMLLLLSKFGGLGRTTIESMLQFAGSDMGLKDAASLWLSAQYGDKLSVSGLESLIRSIDREFLTIRTHTTRFVQGSSRVPLSFVDNERGVTADGYCATRIALKPKDFNAAMRLIRSAYEWDWMPSLGNTWDAVPLSFVVDWFVNIGDIYASIDRLVAARYYDVQAVLNTVKVIAHTTRLPEVEFTYYNRSLSKSLLLSVESVKLGLPSIVNWVNGAALFVGLS